MIVPLVNTKIILQNNTSINLYFVESNAMNIYKFRAINSSTYQELKAYILPETNYEFISSFNGKLYKWQGVINFFIDNELSLIISSATVYDVKDDQRKERVDIQDQVIITEMQFNGRHINLTDKFIPTISKDISESGILLFTKLDLAEMLKYEDSEITINFSGEQLGELGDKKVKIKRIYTDSNNFYYGCQFQIRDFQDLRQINRLIQQLKLQE